MQLCGLVLEFDPAQVAPGETLDALRSWPQCSLGRMQQSHLPVVIEAQNESDAQQWHERLLNLAGVEQVHVAYVGFEPDSNSVESEMHYAI